MANASPLPFHEWIIQVNDVRSPRMIHKVPELFRQKESCKGCFDPVVVSIGPYHHGKSELQDGQRLKYSMAGQFIRDCHRPFSTIYSEVERISGNAREYYPKETVSRFDDDKNAFTRLMFVDGCFVLQFIHNFLNGHEVQHMRSDVAAFVRRDLMLLENQLPYIVLKRLMSLRFEGNGEDLINNFISSFRGDLSPQTTCIQATFKFFDKCCSILKDPCSLCNNGAEEPCNTDQPLQQQNPAVEPNNTDQPRQQQNPAEEPNNTDQPLQQQNPAEEPNNTDQTLQQQNPAEEPNNTDQTLQKQNPAEEPNNTDQLLQRQNPGEEPNNTDQPLQEQNTAEEPNNTDQTLQQQNLVEEPNNTDQTLQQQNPAEEPNNTDQPLQQQNPAEEPNNNNNPLHLLDFFLDRYISKNYPLRNIFQERRGRNWYSYPAAKELRALGIYFRPSAGGYFTNIEFRSTLGTGWLFLPQIMIDDTTKSMLLNLVAYEASPGAPDDNRGLTSYICFMDSLIDQAEDVKVLRSKGIVFNLLGSDQQAAELINDIAQDLAPNPYAFCVTRQRIDSHSSSNCRSWTAECIHSHFRSPWSCIAFIVVLGTIAMTILQTVYASKDHHSGNGK